MCARAHTRTNKPFLCPPTRPKWSLTLETIFCHMDSCLLKRQWREVLTEKHSETFIKSPGQPGYNITRHIKTSITLGASSKCREEREDFTNISAAVVGKMCMTQADFLTGCLDSGAGLPQSCILATVLPPTRQQACRCWTWPSFQNSRSSSVPAH